MKAKEKLILEAAVKLFAQKGVMATSVQEIATESGISKGAFYLYYESKEAVLLAIFQYYFSYIQERMQQVEHEGLPIEQQFVRQLAVQFEAIKDQKSFIIMHTREFAIPLNQDIANFLHRMRADSNAFLHSNLLQIYGKRVEPYLHDLVLLCQGIIHAGFELLLFNQDQIDCDRLAVYFMKRLDSVITGFELSQEKPLLTSDHWQTSCLGNNSCRIEDTKIKLVEAVDQAIHQAEQQTDKDQSHLIMTLDLLKQEMKSKHSRMPLIEGMLHNMGAHPQLHSLRDNIREYYQLQ